MAALLAQAGRFSLRLDVLADCAPFWLAGSILFGGAACLLQRERRVLLGAVAAIGAVLSLGLIAPEFLGGRSAQASAGDQTVKIVQLNTWNRNVRPAQMVRWLHDQDADFVLLQEAYSLDPAYWTQLTARYPHRLTCDLGPSCPVMIFSKTPAVEAQGYYGPGQPLPMVRGRYKLGGHVVDVVAVHFKKQGGWSAERAQQDRLLQVASGANRALLIIGGDFNATPWSFRLRRLDRSLEQGRRTRALATWPSSLFEFFGLAAPFPLFPLDHVYAGPSWRTRSVELGPEQGSDHRPVVVVLSKPKSRG